MRLIDAELMNQICNHTSLSTWFPTSAALPNELEPVLITWVNRAPVSYYEEIKDEPITGVAIYHKGQWWFIRIIAKMCYRNMGKHLTRTQSIDTLML